MTEYNSPAPHMELLYFEQFTNSLGQADRMQHRINFGEIAANFSSMGYGFGIERLDFSRNSRKTVQQTRGQYDNSGKLIDDNFYVDVWWTAPPRIVLSGVVEMPAGKDIQVCYYDSEGKNGRQMKSFLDLMEEFYRNNNNPLKTKNDSLWFFDFMKRQYYNITLKEFNTNVSVDRPNLLIFQVNMDVLKETSDLSEPFNTTRTGGTASTILNTVSGAISNVIYRSFR